MHEQESLFPGKLHKYSIFALCVIFTGPACAYDLRGVSQGSRCEEVSRIELANGATLIDEDDDPTRLIAFAFQNGGTAGLSAYTCDAGVVVDQMVLFMITTEADADRVFANQYSLLKEKFGEPCDDLRQTGLWPRFVLWMKGLYDSDVMNTVSWRLEDELNVTLGRYSPIDRNGEWTVTASISGDPKIFRSNSSGTQDQVRFSTECSLSKTE